MLVYAGDSATDGVPDAVDAVDVDDASLGWGTRQAGGPPSRQQQQNNNNAQHIIFRWNEFSTRTSPM